VYGDAADVVAAEFSLIESIGDATLTVGVHFSLTYGKAHNGEWLDLLRWSQQAIDLADGDPAKGNFVIGSPLAIALLTRAAARYCLGLPGWRGDLHHAVAMARSTDPFSYATVVAYVYFPGIPYGVLAADDPALREIEDARRIAERSGDDMALAFAGVMLGTALVHRHADSERSNGQMLLAEVSDVLLRRGHNLSELRLIKVYMAREKARSGDHDEAISLMCAALNELIREGQLMSWGIPATGVLVETMLERGAKGDVADAAAAIDRLAAAPGIARAGHAGNLAATNARPAGPRSR
jgi:hypothetical protein